MTDEATDVDLDQAIKDGEHDEAVVKRAAKILEMGNLANTDNTSLLSAIQHQITTGQFDTEVKRRVADALQKTTNQF